MWPTGSARKPFVTSADPSATCLEGCEQLQAYKGLFILEFTIWDNMGVVRGLSILERIRLRQGLCLQIAPAIPVQRPDRSVEGLRFETRSASGPSPIEDHREAQPEQRLC